VTACHLVAVNVVSVSWCCFVRIKHIFIVRKSEHYIFSRHCQIKKIVKSFGFMSDDDLFFRKKQTNFLFFMQLHEQSFKVCVDNAHVHNGYNWSSTQKVSQAK
jgi:hypothetical protein